MPATGTPAFRDEDSVVKFTTTHAKEALPDGNSAQHSAWVKAANAALDEGKSESDAKAAGKAAAGKITESRSIRGAALMRLAEVGKVLSAANEEKVRKAHGHLGDVLDGLTKTSGTDNSATALEGRALSLHLMGLQEAGSESASDAARGTWILGELYRMMGDEADEPEQLKLLADAADLVSQWLKAEADEIGTDADEPEPDYLGGWGWEAAARDERHPSVLALQEAAASPLLERDATGTLVEAAVRANGTVPLKLISPGWGSSGYYGDKLLKERGPKVFKAGTQMFWDHPTRTEESDRPERSLRDLAAKLVTDAAWDANGAKGPGLYADAKVYEAFQPAVDELAGDIGVSIRAMGTGHRGEADGKTGVIIDDLVEVASVDFVTVAGRGGEILPLFEAARERARAAQTPPSPTPTPTKEDPAVDLKEAQALQAENARLREQIVLGEAKDVVTVEVAKATKLPKITRDRLERSLLESDLPTVETDGKVTLDKPKFVTSIEAAIKDEETYLATVRKENGAGKVRGLGAVLTESGEVDEAKLDEGLAKTFGNLGLSEAGSKLAAAGRE
jgi:hypothetical protein